MTKPSRLEQLDTLLDELNQIRRKTDNLYLGTATDMIENAIRNVEDEIQVELFNEHQKQRGKR